MRAGWMTRAEQAPTFAMATAPPILWGERIEHQWMHAAKWAQIQCTYPVELAAPEYTRGAVSVMRDSGLQLLPATTRLWHCQEALTLTLTLRMQPSANVYELAESSRP